MDENNSKKSTDLIQKFLQKTVDVFDSANLKEKKPLYIAIDSDVLRHLTLLNILKKQHGTIDVRKINDDGLKRDFNYFIRLYNCVLHDEIRLLIVDAVYQESKHSSALIDFMKEYCYFPNVNAINYQDKTEEARKLANAYTESYIYNGEVHEAPMKKVYVADIKKYVPTNDCYIMAQATVEQCPLLTGNGQDYVFNKRSDPYYYNSRVKGIVYVNINNGYFTENANGDKKTTSPILIHTLGPILKNLSLYETMEQIDDKVKGDLIL